MSEQGGFLLVLRPPGPSWSDVAPRLDELKEITGLDAGTIRLRFVGRGVATLKRGPRAEPLESIAERLTAAGVPSAVMAERELDDLPRPVRATQVRRSGAEVQLLDPAGHVLASVGSASRVHAALADLRTSESLAARIAGKPWAAKANHATAWEGPVMAACRGEPVLDLLIDPGPIWIRILGRRFSYSGLEGETQPGVPQNLTTLVRWLSAAAGSFRMDLDAGEAIPLLAPDASLTLHGILPHSLEQAEGRFAVHAALSYRAACRGLPDPAPIPAPSQGGTSAPRLEPIGSSGKGVETTAGRLRRSMLDPLRRLGPVWLLLPAIPIAFGLYVAGILISDDRLPGAALIVLGTGALGVGFTALARLRYVQNVPTARIRSLPMGAVEVRGAAHQLVPLKTPFSLLDCVHFRYEIQRWSQDGRGRGSWKTVKSGGSGPVPFEIQDETGRVLVDPRGAIVDIHHKETLRTPRALTRESGPASLPSSALLQGGNVRYREWFIPARFPVYVTGVATRRREANDLRPADAVPDPDAPPPLEHVVIGKGRSRLFYISDRTQDSLLRRLRLRSLLALALGVALVLGGTVLFARGGSP